MTIGEPPPGRLAAQPGMPERQPAENAVARHLSLALAFAALAWFALGEIDLRIWAAKPHSNVGFSDVFLVGAIRTVTFVVVVLVVLGACLWHYLAVRRMPSRPALGEALRYAALAGVAGAAILFLVPVKGPDAASMKPVADQLLLTDVAAQASAPPDTREIIPTSDPRELHIIFLEQARSRLELEGEATFAPSRIVMEPDPSYLGIYGESPRQDGKWTRLSQQFWAHPNRILLTEWDFVAAGRPAQLHPSFRNAKVHEAPAFRRCRVSPAGRGICQVSWVSPDRYYELRVEGFVNGGLAATALRIAEAVQPQP